MTKGSSRWGRGGVGLRGTVCYSVARFSSRESGGITYPLSPIFFLVLTASLGILFYHYCGPRLHGSYTITIFALTVCLEVTASTGISSQVVSRMQAHSRILYNYPCFYPATPATAESHDAGIDFM